MKYGTRTTSSHINSSKPLPGNIYDLHEMREEKEKSQFRSLLAGEENAARGIFQCSFCHENHPSYANRNWEDLAKDFGPSHFSSCSSLSLQMIPVCFNALKCFGIRRWVSACHV
ncbi:hypothetical protein CEXT_809211 [Caerostris extrusa]|uniref:Uncharacterized protein n=1 Tax=Caerostris extrusa TaxID=172846 RepID=A0AAV4VZU8_CAEEX|nr:hypothetical protein CEXT_809211 [Caerostris extrusa]